MAIIFTYPVIKAADLASTDRLIISKMNSVGNNPTKSLTLADLSTYISAALTPSVTGSGTTNTIPIWTSSTSLGDSIATQINFASYDTNKAVQISGALSQINLGYSTYVGISAGSQDTNPGGAFDGNYNVGIGNDALASYTSGKVFGADAAGENVAIGASSLALLTTGTNNVAIGVFAGQELTESRNNIAVGKNAMRYIDNIDANSNIAIGLETLGDLNLTGKTIASNTVLGVTALQDTSSAMKDNVFVGFGSGKLSTFTTHEKNTVVGTKALTSLPVGTILSDSVFIGYEAGKGLGRTGSSSLKDIGIGYRTFFGSSSGFSSAGENIAIGANANGNNTTSDIEGSIMIGSGASSGNAGSYSTIIGTQQSGTTNESLGVMGVILGGYAHSQNAPQGGCILGRSNTVDAAATNSVALGGFSTTITGANSAGLGTGLTVAAAQTVVGKYNINVNNARFIVGIGTAVGAEDNGFEVLATGKLRARKYGINTFADDAAYNLSVKANGEIIETPALPTVADDYPDDTAAAAAGIPQGGFYHTSGVVKINITP